MWQLTGLHTMIMMMMLATEQIIYTYLMFIGPCIIVITAE